MGIVLAFMTILVGAALTGTGLALRSMAKTSGIALKWWHWLLFGISGLFWLISFAWLGSMLTDRLGGQVFIGGTLFGWGILFLISILLGFGTWRLAAGNRKKETL
jgi:hypothetical protein